ncbi:hypothetical protein ACIBEA_15455 [Streptomyces sp. NPDC051555]|uniref:hypothetical protein n=1 Tax=Streptomyces sp. NPDC051555 TaxID=3365657 RepID=UPI00379CA46D
MTATETPEVLLPETVWASRGWFVGSGTAALVAARLTALHAGNVVEDWARAQDAGRGDGPDMVFDARWRAGDGVRVRARLILCDDPREGGTLWQLTAQAAQAWDWAWPSPLTQFVPVGTLAVCDQPRGALFGEVCQLPLDTALRGHLRELAQSPWTVGVLVHEPHLVYPPTPALAALPPGMLGRILEYRVIGDQRQAVNRLLHTTGVKLPPGGAVIIPSHPPRPGISLRDLEIRDDTAADPAPLLAAVLQHAAAPWPATPAILALVRDLQATWTLDTDTERLEQAAAALQAKDRQLKALTADRDTWRQLATTHERDLKDAVLAARDATSREQTALRRLRDTEQHLADLKDATATGALTAAAEAAETRREQAEQDVEAAEELLDSQNTEIIRLRARLATASTPSSLPQTAPPTPDSWEQLAHQAHRELTRIVLADITASTVPLRGHPLEQVWIRRTWQTLNTLQAYAEAATRHGPQLLPHLAAYLRWPDAKDLIPATRHAPGESESLTTNSRLRESRTFPVPRTIDPTGRVFMSEHIRIGSGRPPALRLHLHDDTHGRTRQIHIGYIGPHLP